MTGFAVGAREHDAVSRDVHAGRPHLLAVDAPAVDAARLGHRARLHMSRVGAVLRLGQSERNDDFAFEAAADELSFLRGAAEVAHHHDEREITDHRMLVLQIVVQAEALRREMLANHCHPQIRAAVAAILARQREAIEAGAIGAAPRFPQ